MIKVLKLESDSGALYMAGWVIMQDLPQIILYFSGLNYLMNLQITIILGLLGPLGGLR